MPVWRRAVSVVGDTVELAYVDQSRDALGAEADRPHRITYKKLVRA